MNETAEAAPGPVGLPQTCFRARSWCAPAPRAPVPRARAVRRCPCSSRRMRAGFSVRGSRPGLCAPDDPPWRGPKWGRIVNPPAIFGADLIDPGSAAHGLSRGGRGGGGGGGTGCRGHRRRCAYPRSWPCRQRDGAGAVVPRESLRAPRFWRRRAIWPTGSFPLRAVDRCGRGSGSAGSADDDERLAVAAGPLGPSAWASSRHLWQTKAGWSRPRGGAASSPRAAQEAETSGPDQAQDASRSGRLRADAGAAISLSAAQPEWLSGIPRAVSVLFFAALRRGWSSGDPRKRSSGSRRSRRRLPRGARCRHDGRLLQFHGGRQGADPACRLGPARQHHRGGRPRGRCAPPEEVLAQCRGGRGLAPGSA